MRPQCRRMYTDRSGDGRRRNSDGYRRGTYKSCAVNIVVSGVAQNQRRPRSPEGSRQISSGLDCVRRDFGFVGGIISHC